MAGCVDGEGTFMSKYTFRRVPLTTVMLEHLIENWNVEGKVVGVFAGDVHPEIDDSCDRLKWMKWMLFSKLLYPKQH